MIHAYAAHNVKAPLEAYTYEPEDIGLFGTEIEISHCGVCHSDVHLVDGDWGMGSYPMVPGHEIIGTVRSVGSAVDSNLIGKRVGVGWQRGSCLQCESCLTGQEELCQQAVQTCVNHYGGFAQRIIVDSRFTHQLPDALSSENAAPLLCAGITVYSPLKRYARHQARVGIVGIGGLGHLAIQYANKMGCEVTAFSSNPAKEDESYELGAHTFINSGDRSALKQARRSLDLIISTAPANLDWTPYISALRANGVLCFVGAPSEPIQVHIGRLMDNKSIAGSSTGGRQMTREMLAFSAQHQIQAWTERLDMDQVNEAFSRLRQNDVRYRFVLEN